MIKNKINILIIFGTRPEVIKMAPVILELNKDKYKSKINLKICSTGQHKEMVTPLFKFFKIKIDYNLDLMNRNQNLTQLISNIQIGVQNIFKKYVPNIVLVHGDTSTAMASSIACFISKISVFHVEAGLRTHNLSSPFPEEFNRRIISLSSSFHFAPTILSKNNLINEGIKNKDIIVTGNTVIDALKYTINKISHTSKLKKIIINRLNEIVNFDIQKNKYVLITGHRRENFGQGFLNICNAISILSIKFPNYYFVYPVHLNPNVKEVVYEILSNKKNIKLVNPVEYEYFSILMKESDFILTDSGGIQEEAPSLGKPVLVMRSETERPEGVRAGTILLVSSNTKKIVHNVSELIENKILYKKMSKLKNPYGNGTASKIIVKKLLSV